jgi:eukaryotic-like serine/threonine-protein kinase
MNSPTLIKASQYSQFTDGSGRHNYFSKDMQFVPLKLTAPKQTSPKSGSVFSIYPRTTTLKWKPVSGAASYTVEIDCYHCCQANKWCTDVGKTWQIFPGITTTSYTFDFVGAQPGRWRVWAVDEDGKAGPKSGWWTFTYKI